MMSADAASLPCPICSHIGVFNSVQSLRDRLIFVSTNKISCPVCQEEVVGLDKLTIHLFGHVSLSPQNMGNTNEKEDSPKNIQNEVILKVNKIQQKKSKPSTAKNKSPAVPNSPVKFVKIYPKLPIISLNPVPMVEIPQSQPPQTKNAGDPMDLQTVKSEGTVSQTNTVCTVCGIQFVDANILRMHRLLIHNIDENSNVNSTRYHCHVCPKNFKMRGSLMVHLRVAHYGFSSKDCNTDSNVEKSAVGQNVQATENKPTSLERNDTKQWQCDVCRKCFTTKYFLKKHKRLHTGETPYACTQCNKTFTFQQSYHKHLLYHNDEKPHVCTYCGRAFKELSTLHNHQRIHTGEKPFSCETCGKCFRQRVSYLVHKRIHTGVMPYKCTACDKSFRYKVSQRTHKCHAQPPGTVVRQTGDLVEKLRKKHVDEPLQENQEHKNQEKLNIDNQQNTTFPEVSEANAELVRIGAKLSLEDMESDSFSFIADVFKSVQTDNCTNSNDTSDATNNDVSKVLTPTIEDLIDVIPESDKNVPSPSEILKNLCLSRDEDYVDILPYQM